MAKSILIVAESGSGKTTATENLPPKETFIINPAGKDLPFRGWKKNYTLWSPQTPNGNLYTKSGAAQISDCMKYVSMKRPDIKYLVVDDFQYIFGFEFFDRSAETGFQKFTDIGANMARLSRLPIELREDLTIFFLMHIEKGSDVEGAVKYKAKTIGKMVDEKLTLEGLFTIVLFGDVKKQKDGSMKYVFETQTNGNNTCKAPRGMFPSHEIPNDYLYVAKCIEAYDNGDEAPALPAGFVPSALKAATPAAAKPAQPAAQPALA